MGNIPDEDFWQAMIRQASSLSDEDLKRHAHVSRDNRHRCTSCFCCACLTEAERKGLIAKPRKANHV